MNARQDKRFILTFSALLYIKIMQNSGIQRGDLTGILVAKEKKLVTMVTILVAISSHVFTKTYFRNRLRYKILSSYFYLSYMSKWIHLNYGIDTWAIHLDLLKSFMKSDFEILMKIYSKLYGKIQT